MKLIRDFACRQCEIGPRHFPVFSVQSMIISRLVHTHIAAGCDPIHQARLNSHPQKKKKKKMLSAIHLSPSLLSVEEDKKKTTSIISNSCAILVMM